jgi:diadenosine tetraphosphate (Ap4A) HIT family hydrolase
VSIDVLKRFAERTETTVRGIQHMAAEVPATDCIFCKIIAGQIPSMCVLETQSALAFMDVGPLADAHLLVIPKRHFARLDEMPEEELRDLSALLPRLARIVVAVTEAEGYNILQNNGKVAGQAVDHVHFHVIPRKEADGLGYRWPAKTYEPGRAEEIHGQLLQALKASE